jgi:type IX secretion system PorP/SprF family membrane protein
MKFYKKYIALLITVIAFNFVYSQDPVFTQFYSNALHLNPAFAGRDLSPRFHSSYRDQWPGINKAFVTYNIEYDQFSDDLHGGVGFQILHDRSGGGLLNSTQFAACYAYQLLIDRNWTLNFGIKAAAVQKNLDWGNAQWGDEIDATKGFVNPTNQPQGANTNYLDLSNGFVLFGKNLFLGASFNHLSKPNETFFYNIDDNITVDRIPIRTSMHGGYKIKILKNGLFHKELFLTPEFVFDFQKNLKRYNFGTYFVDGIFDLGLWYRHTRFLDANNDKVAPQDALVFVLGVENNNIRVGYSYDFNLSRLIVSSSGAHEISFTIDLPEKKQHASKFRVVNCPQF